MKFFKIFLVTIIFILFTLGLGFYLYGNFIDTSSSSNDGSNFIILKSYTHLKEAVENGDYLDYPSKTKPLLGKYSNERFNPRTNRQLELDTSQGGGYKCCEQPTFYVWVDTEDKIFWVNTYQASLESISSEWYGPFGLE